MTHNKSSSFQNKIRITIFEISNNTSLLGNIIHKSYIYDNRYIKKIISRKFILYY